MKERPILFNGDMVRAILEGRKTQTRRVMKVQPSANFSPMNMAFELDYNARWYIPGIVDKDGHLQPAKKQVFGVADEDEGYACPLGAVGDRLWVRETWGVVSHDLDDNGSIIDWVPDRPVTPIHEMPFGNGYYSGHAMYAADGSFAWGNDDGHVDGRSCWKPSLHMPRLASRILLEITAVRVERLNDISEKDALAEGFISDAKVTESGDDYTGLYASDRFSDTWQKIYEQKSWLENPWVWVISFKRLEGQT